LASIGTPSASSGVADQQECEGRPAAEQHERQHRHAGQQGDQQHDGRRHAERLGIMRELLAQRLVGGALHAGL
jgi:hypothetical protein